MNIRIREEEERDYRRSEEIIREAFSYPGRVERGGIGCPSVDVGELSVSGT